MAIDFASINSTQYIADLKTSLYAWTNQAAGKSSFTRILSPAIAIGDGALTLAGRISYMAEALLKSLSNLIGSPVSNRLSFFRGVEQLVSKIPASVGKLIASPVEVAFRVTGATISILLSPQKFAQFQINFNAPKAASVDAVDDIDGTEVALQPSTDLRSRLYLWVEQHAKKSSLVRLLAPAIGMSDGLITLVNRVARAAQVLLEGFGNIIGFPFSRSLSFFQGVEQLSSKLPAALGKALVSPIEVAFRVAAASVSVLISPEGFARFQIHFDEVIVPETEAEVFLADLGGEGSTVLATDSTAAAQAPVPAPVPAPIVETAAQPTRVVQQTQPAPIYFDPDNLVSIS